MAKDKDKTPADVSKMIKDHDVKLVDFKFTDLPGSWQHFTTTLTEYNEEIFTDGLGFDGSSIRGWRAINASDMLVIPDPSTAWIDLQRRAHAQPHLHHRRSNHARALRSRPTRRSGKSRGLSAKHRHRGHSFVRAGSGVLHLRRSALQLHRQLLFPPGR